MQAFNMTRTAWLTCLVAALFPFYSFFQMNLFNVMGPHLVEANHFTLFQVGLLSASFLYAQAALLIIAGLILDRYSTRRIILIAMTMVATGTLMFAFGHSIGVLFFARILTGCAHAFAILGCFQLIVRYFPVDKNSLLMGIVITIALCGGLCAQTPFLLVVNTLGMHTAMLLNALLGYVITILLFGVLVDPPPQNENNRVAIEKIPILLQLKTIMTTMQNWLCGFYASIMSFPLLVLGAAWGASYLVDAHMISKLEATSATLMIFIGMIIGTPIAGAIADFSKYKRNVLIASPALMALVFLIIILFKPLPLSILILLFFIKGLLSGPQVLVYPMIVSNNNPQLAGLALGFSSTLIILCGAIAQTLLSGLAATLGFDLAIFLLPMALLLCVILALKIK